MCNFCGVSEETLLHMFWDCAKVQSFWKLFIDWLHRNVVHCMNINLSKKLILFGRVANIVTDKVFDLLILCAKYHIFTCKMNKKTPHFQTFLKTMNQTFECERYNAMICNAAGKFHKNWRLYSHAFIRSGWDKQLGYIHASHYPIYVYMLNPNTPPTPPALSFMSLCVVYVLYNIVKCKKQIKKKKRKKDAVTWLCYFRRRSKRIMCSADFSRYDCAPSFTFLFQS